MSHMWIRHKISWVAKNYNSTKCLHLALFLEFDWNLMVYISYASELMLNSAICHKLLLKTLTNFEKKISLRFSNTLKIRINGNHFRYAQTPHIKYKRKQLFCQNCLLIRQKSCTHAHIVCINIYCVCIVCDQRLFIISPFAVYPTLSIYCKSTDWI